MRIIHISDTHSKHNRLGELPAADILVHSGDFTWAGSEQEAYDFLNWLCDLPYKHKIFIAGNHDDCMYGAGTIEGLPENVHYLCNSSITIDGLKFYGVPMFMQDCIDGIYDKLFQSIPEDTDVLISHQPPRIICDWADSGNNPTRHGDPILAERVSKLNFKYHLFGHEHDANGTIKIGKTIFSNASILNNEYNIVNKARLFEI